jgi:DNA-binding LytR/AlgR family response regulator
MNVAIIEDEPIAADRLEKLILETDPSIKVVVKLQSVRESVRWLMRNTADLLFLDIQLSDGLSFSIFEEVTVHTPVIFTTAYDQYTIRAFRLNSIAYLLKPVNKTELQESLAKYHTLKSVFTQDIGRLLETLEGRDPGYRKRFLIQYGDRIKKLEVSEIAWFQAMEKSVFIRTLTDQSFPSDHTLDQLEQMLDPEKFFRINRKFLVHIEAIASMTAWSRGRIRLDLRPSPGEDSDTIVSTDRSPGFRKWLNA